ncbi:hypothetical protein LCGC14_1042420 [marine sediment metagenome]|uniref:Uncharacterized protein n=1 Tax=marine sediment metagenome TaxID=412755 RepID=A0A0F9Q9N7_9ZZZZ
MSATKKPLLAPDTEAMVLRGGVTDTERVKRCCWVCEHYGVDTGGYAYCAEDKFKAEDLAVVACEFVCKDFQLKKELAG